MSTYIQSRQMWKWAILTIYWISNKANTFILRFMKYHARKWIGHGSVPENNEQPFKFTVFKSALGLIHDKSSLLQEWLGAISHQAITSRYHLSQCCPRSMSPHGVAGRMSYSQTQLQPSCGCPKWNNPSLLTYFRPRQNRRHFADMFTYIFLEEMYQFRLKFY